MKEKSIKVNAVLNCIKQMCTVIFPLITIPYVSRILGTENYGMFNFGSTYVGYFSLISTFGINVYAVREGAKLRNDKEKLKVFSNQVFSINIITTLISYCFLYLIIFCSDKFIGYRLLISVQSIVIIFNTLGIDWANTIYEDFMYTTCRYILVQVLSFVPLFMFVKSPNHYIIYASIVVFANVMGNIFNIIYISKKYIKVKFTHKMDIRKHFGPMLYLFGNSLASTIYVYSDITLITFFEGNKATGIYSISVKIYTIAKQLINAIISVAIPRAAVYWKDKDKTSYNQLLNKMIHAVFWFALPMTIGLFALSNNAIRLIAGDSYIEGSTSLRILSVAIFFAVMSYLFVYLVLITIGMEKICFKVTLISAIINVLLNLIFIPILGINGAAITTLISELLVLFLSIWYAKKKIHISIKITTILPGIIASVLVTCACICVKNIFTNYIIQILFSVLFSLILYIVITYLLKDEFSVDFIDKLFGIMKKREQK